MQSQQDARLTFGIGKKKREIAYVPVRKLLQHLPWQ
jgi:hypothetical protein